MINAQIIADSINPAGNRLTTYILTFNRWILAELNTHRVFSRNTASSRAIPTEKMMNMAMTNPAMPVFWGKNQSGMQSDVELVGEELEKAKDAWLRARDRALESAKELLACGMHKQYVNRTIENFLYVKTILSGTEFENFFSLRAHKDAQPEFRKLAYLMLDLYQKSEPKRLGVSEWHVPFGDQFDDCGIDHIAARWKVLYGTKPSDSHIFWKDKIKLDIATARCARISYLNFEGKDDYTADIRLTQSRLAPSGHWSAFEHCAQALATPTQCGNFVGWRQYRKFFPNENRRDERVQRYKAL